MVGDHDCVSTASGGTLKADGLPDGFVLSATNLSVEVNQGDDGNRVVDFMDVTFMIVDRGHDTRFVDD